MATTMFHWDPAPWAIYAVVGLAASRTASTARGRVQLISAFPLPAPAPRRRRLPDRHVTFWRPSSALPPAGLGALQISGGLEIVGDRPARRHLVVIIAVLTVAFHVLSAVSTSPRTSSGSPTPTWCRRSPGLLPVRRRPDGLSSQPGAHRWQLRPGPRRWLPRTGAEGSATGPGKLLDRLLLGLVALPTPFVGMFIARISMRDAPSASSSPASSSSPAPSSVLWFCIPRRHRHRPAGGVPRHRRRRRARGPALPAPSGFPWATVQHPGDGLVRSSSSPAPTPHPSWAASPRRSTTSSHVVPVSSGGVATGAVAAVMLLAGAPTPEGLQTITIVAALPFVVIAVGLAVPDEGPARGPADGAQAVRARRPPSSRPSSPASPSTATTSRSPSSPPGRPSRRPVGADEAPSCRGPVLGEATAGAREVLEGAGRRPRGHQGSHDPGFLVLGGFAKVRSAGIPVNRRFLQRRSCGLSATRSPRSHWPHRSRPGIPGASGGLPRSGGILVFRDLLVAPQRQRRPTRPDDQVWT